ncbi:hypothetical protein MVI27_08015 [Chryseobacterium salipaludis]|uniref:hypothetical protein n=1 Tax=Chryseobacterium TaxID=59732 RepID=UPI001FF34E07|nr:MULTISPECIES: hypothetical protein [Chryseobacterium]MCJ8498203.1 hypothetical protein [Chryseobacterium salipaludis]MCX3297549.1 hypothetical protein [Planobacterium sp. JC490]
MFYVYLLLALLLSLGLFFSVLKTGRLALWSRIYRIVVVTAGIILFTSVFVRKSIDHFRPDALAIQVINKLPFTLDFYLVKINNTNPEEHLPKFETLHSGTIRSDYYRVEYLDMKHSDQYWLVGYMGKKNLVYFSQHAVPNKNEDQIIEVKSYIVQSSKLAASARKEIESLKLENIRTAVWITLDLLLLFLNLALLFRWKK